MRQRQEEQNLRSARFLLGFIFVSDLQKPDDAISCLGKEVSGESSIGGRRTACVSNGEGGPAVASVGPGGMLLSDSRDIVVGDLCN